MEIEWDEEKDGQNRAKHGVGLGEAARLEWGKAETFTDIRKDYGEVRKVATAPLEGRLHVCIFTMRGAAFRVISLRKANRSERQDYDSNQARR